MGPVWTVQRLAYGLRRRAGLLARRTPATGWSPPRPETTSIRPLWNRQPGSPVTAPPSLTALRRGTTHLFGAEYDIGRPPRWRIDPVTGEEWPLHHWTKLDNLGGTDVKFVWELGRFGFVADLMRADVAGDTDAGAMYWSALHSFMADNPPNLGPHWMCGQETALRAMALLVGASTFAKPTTTHRDRSALVSLLEASASRIEANLSYARLQGNNHAINEALGLWLIGVLVPTLPRAARWEALGRRVVIEELDDQIADDGSYIQQSLRYHRFVLESCGLALAVGTATGRPWPATTVDRIRTAAEFLADLADPVSGRLPNYGSNDGAVLLPLHSCPDSDARPALALALAATRSDRSVGSGPWDELPMWLGLDPAPREAKPSPRRQVHSSGGGYATLLGEESWLATRAYRQDHRPAQADQLHVDLWWNGVNVIADPGTYRYNAAPPWRNALSSTAVHNTCTVDGADQMDRGANFLWLNRAHGSVESSVSSRIVMSHDGYRRLGVTHRRTVEHAAPDRWSVTDDILGAGVHDLGWTWLLPESELLELDTGHAELSCAAGAFTIGFAGPGTLTVARPTPHDADPRGWWSPTYGMRHAVTCLTVSWSGPLPARFVTEIRLGPEAGGTAG